LGGGVGDERSAVGGGGDLVAVGHPHGGPLGDGVEESFVVVEVEAGASELAAVGLFHVGAEDSAGELHAVADAEDWDAEGEDLRIAGGGAWFIDAGGSAG